MLLALWAFSSGSGGGGTTGIFILPDSNARPIEFNLYSRESLCKKTLSV